MKKPKSKPKLKKPKKKKIVYISSESEEEDYYDEVPKAEQKRTYYQPEPDNARPLKFSDIIKFL